MRDPTYMKRAVELAQWQTTRLGNQRVAVFIPTDDKETVQRIGYLDEQYVLDALAAQLVRQVDALDTPDTVEITHDSVWVGYRSKNNESWKRTKHTKSRDRTMNTIKAIVDRGVLTTGDS